MNTLSRVSYAFFLGVIAHVPLSSAFAGDLKGKFPNGELSFECLRDEEPDAPSRLYIWKTDQPEDRKLVFTSRWPIEHVLPSPNAEWIAVMVARAKPGKDIALLRQTSPLNYEHDERTGDGRLLRMLTLRAYSEQGAGAAAYSYDAKIKQADFAVTGWSADSTTASVFLRATIVLGMDQSRDYVTWTGVLEVPSLKFVSDAARR